MGGVGDDHSTITSVKDSDKVYSYLNKCEYYDIKNDLFVPIADLNHPKEQSSACMFKQDFIYLFGGIDKNESHKQYEMNYFERYNI